LHPAMLMSRAANAVPVRSFHGFGVRRLPIPGFRKR